MDKYLLTICIPTYNRKQLFEISLRKAIDAIKGMESKVEIVIGDNASEENIYEVVQQLILLNPNITIRYFRNEINLGFKGNLKLVTQKSRGKFCWVIGNDDFIKKEALHDIIKIIESNNDIHYICVNYSTLKIYKSYDNNKDNPYEVILEDLNDDRKLVKHIAPEEIGEINKFDMLLHPKYNNVFLGSIMVSITKRDIWSKINDIKEEKINISNVENAYPHCLVYARSLIGKKAYYYGKPAIIVGEGAREWESNDKDLFWKSSLPVIYLKILDQVIDEYEKNGLDSSIVYECRKKYTEMISILILKYVKRKYFDKKEIEMDNEIEICYIIKKYYKFKSLYKSIFDRIKDRFLNYFN